MISSNGQTWHHMSISSETERERTQWYVWLSVGSSTAPVILIMSSATSITNERPTDRLSNWAHVKRNLLLSPVTNRTKLNSPTTRTVDHAVMRQKSINYTQFDTDTDKNHKRMSHANPPLEQAEAVWGFKPREFSTPMWVSTPTKTFVQHPWW